MKMNQVETVAMNSVVRRVVQRRLVFPLMQELGGPLRSGSRILELGCGSGYGSQLLLDEVEAAHVDAIDLDPAMVARARRRLAPYRGRARVGVADATDMAALTPVDGCYDVVVAFGTLHHIPDWQAALAEVARLLRPGGVFYFEEMTVHALNRFCFRHFTEHPTVNRFTDVELLGEMESLGLAVTGHRTFCSGQVVYGGCQRIG
ncbi:class I SAM-dependent methyltransferase [Actinomadura fibrosa]|uniref:Class I SAM-dependent methyltransferase n=1 Tax=Actinomadura fibrosa TaxID=111802 RepID=A0ABW2XZU2_9ACTN|nr:class I SAM-dependent methyltransferase [Actinomadura fibrosa]